MIKHAFKIITNQWRKNVWITIELFIVLSVLWFTVDFFSVLWLTSRTPVGFDINDTYLVSLALTPEESPNYIEYEAGSDEPGMNFMRLVDRIRLHPNVEAVSIGIFHYPYSTATMSSAISQDDRYINCNILTVTPEYFDVFRVKSLHGESNKQLGAALQDGNIISRSFEELIFPGSSAIGKAAYTIWQGDTIMVYRFNSVVNTMKRNPFMRPENYMFSLFKENDFSLGEMKMDEKTIWNRVSICIRTRHSSNTTEMATSLKQELKGSLEEGNFSLADITPMSELKDRMLWTYGVYDTLQYTTFFTVFFLVNVFLGVLGTFWLRINKRREEIGLRMALGSSRRRLVSQMHIESFVLVCIAAIPAALVWMNIVFAELLSTDNFDVTASRLVLNTVFALGLTALAAALATWYPARKAASMPAAEALRYE